MSYGTDEDICAIRAVRVIDGSFQFNELSPLVVKPDKISSMNLLVYRMLCFLGFVVGCLLLFQIEMMLHTNKSTNTSINKSTNTTLDQ